MSEDQIMDALRPVIDPELGASIVDLGLVDEIRLKGENLTVQIGTTSPSCPMGQYLVDSARQILRDQFSKFQEIEVLLAWNPTWSPERMSPELKERFGWA
ncbi:DUF59 domain-containing protein [bacterium]|nr:DUF59 domain-containing protein [bacterium]